MMSFLTILDVILIIVLFGFNSWSIFLAISGMTTLEFMSIFSEHKKFNFDFSFPNMNDNLFKIFGTQSYFKMLSPSLRYSPFTGLEWSF
jgi:hypothetical protein